MKNIFIIVLLLLSLISKSQCAYPDSCLITASIAYLGDSAQGDYSIFYADPGHVLDNPVIIVEGLDFNNNIGCSYFHDISGIPDALNSYGYDVVFLNLHQNLGYAQKNAFLIVELINKINLLKSGNNKLIVAGINSSAVEVRYALSYMEAHNIDHQTKCFLSIDGAQRGFNIPLTLQVWIAQIAADGTFFGNYDAIAYNSLLQQPIFSQLLYCDRARSASKDYPIPSVAYDDFFSELRSLNGCYGYPTKCKKIAISNGSITSESQLKVDYTHAVSTNLFFSYENSTGNALSSFSGEVYATYDTSVRPIILAGNHPLEVGVSDYFNFFLYSLDSVNYFRPYDVCPGSYSEFVSLASYGVQSYAASDTTVFINATFVPTVSAFDINTDDFYFDLVAHAPIDGHVSPFDKTYSFNGLNNDANYFDFYSLAINTDILSEISSSDSYTFCDEQDFTIGNTLIGSDSNQSWDVSRYLNTSTFVADSGSTTTLKAGASISMNPGFELKRGAVGNMIIEPCNYNVCTPPSFKTTSVFPNPINQDTIHREHEISQSFDFYPNPANTNLNIKLSNFDYRNSDLLLYNSQGAMIKKIAIYQQQFQINISDFAPGVYSLLLKSNNLYESKRFSIVHY